MAVVKTRYGGDREVRLFENTSVIPSPGIWSPSASVGAVPSLAIPAVAAAVRLVSESIGGFVMRVFEGDQAEREPVMDSWQATLFQQPNLDTSSFDFWCDVIASLELYPHAIIQKTVSGGQVRELRIIPPDWAWCETDPKTGEHRVKANVGGTTRDVTSSVIHIRAWSPLAKPCGESTTDLHTPTLKTAGAFEQFRQAYFDNAGQPGVVIKHPGNPNDEQRQQILESWLQRQGGARNAHRPGLVWGGMEIESFPSSMRDAQGPEVLTSIVEDVARAFRIYPADLLHVTVAGGGSGVGDVWADQFARFSLFHRMRRVERALSTDPDLFPQRRRYARFDSSDFTRANIDTLASVAHQLTQVGVLTKNEARAMLDLPSIDGGDTVQETPVGGSPNANGQLALPAAGD